MCAAIPAGYLCDRFGRKPVMLASGYVTIAGKLIQILGFAFVPLWPLLFVGRLVISALIPYTLGSDGRFRLDVWVYCTCPNDVDVDEPGNSRDPRITAFF